MVGMGKAMNEWMSALPISKDLADGEAWGGLGRVRDSLLDAAGSEVEDMVSMWGWHERLEAPKSRDEPSSVPAGNYPNPIFEQQPSTPAGATVGIRGSVTGLTSPETTPKVPSFPTAPRQAVLPPDPRYSKPHLHLSSRSDTPSSSLPRIPQSTAIKDPLKYESSSNSSNTTGRVRELASDSRDDLDMSDPLAGLHISSDPLGSMNGTTRPDRIKTRNG